jgi:riboflavin kinase/FMN adenylyltransferase
VSIGNFDGVHLGHQAILAEARRQRDRLRAEGSAGLGVASGLPASDEVELVVVTFEPHPMSVLRPRLAPPRLMSIEQKRRSLADEGVDRLIELAPTPDVLGLEAEAFYSLLRDRARVRHLVEGRDFNFGRDRRGTLERLAEWCARDGIGLTRLAGESVTLPDGSIVEVSSSVIRWLVAHGRVRDAGVLLGRPYALRGVVTKGDQRGRTIGFPTANLDTGDQLLPDAGVYAGSCQVESVAPHAKHIACEVYPVAISVGHKPTFGGTQTTVEAHLLDFTGDLYGRIVELRFTDFLRDQSPFPSVNALRLQLQRDVDRIRQMMLSPRVPRHSTVGV